jgi:5'-nucleotidase
VVGGSNPLVPTIFFIVTLIFLTNDDGVEAEGLRILEESLAGLGEIVVLAPDRERSAVSHGLTIRSPLAMHQIRPGFYSLDGTPVDCVVYALKHTLITTPDLVVSGINHGANLGEDIMYSGTVAAAREASMRGIPAIAISQAYDERPTSFKKAAEFARRLIETMLEQRSYGGICLNVNIPVGKVRGVKITRQFCGRHYPHFNSLDRDGAGEKPEEEAAEVQARSDIPPDYQVVMDGYISVTPLQRDQTDYATANSLLKDVPRLFRRSRFPGIGLIG